MNKPPKKLLEQVKDKLGLKQYSIDMYAQMMHQYAYEDDTKH